MPFYSPSDADRLADADVNRPPSPSPRRDVDPRPGGAVVPRGQEHPIAVEEAAETEMPSVFEEVAANDAATLKIAAAFEIPATIEIVIPIGAVKQTSVTVFVTKAVTIAEPVAITIGEAVTILVKVLTVHVCGCAVREIARSPIGSHAGRGAAARSPRGAAEARPRSAGTSWTWSLG